MERVRGATGKTKAKGNLRPARVDPDLATAISHPLRVHILDVISEAPASPSDLARDVGLNVNHVAYHVKELEKLGYVELVKTVPRRGTVEHYYQAKRRLFFDDSEWDRLPVPLKQDLSAGIVRAIAAEAREALVAGTIDARSCHLSNTTLFVDEEGWEELRSALDEMLEKVLTMQAECAGRLEASDEKPFPVSVSLAGFEVPPKSSPEPEAPTA